MSDTKFRFFLTQYEGRIYLEDETVYPCEINNTSYERVDIALAIVYSTDNGQTYKSILSNDYSAELDPGSADIVETMVQVIKVYESRAFAVNELTYHNNHFYVSKINNNNHVPNPENENWILLEEDTAVSYLIQNSGLGFFLTKVESYHSVPESTTFEVNKLSETDYQFINNKPSEMTVHSLKLYDWEDNFIAHIADTFQIDEDGAYKVQVNYTEGPGIPAEMEEDPVNPGGDITLGQDKGTDPGNMVSEIQYIDMLETYIPVIRIDNIECCYKKMVMSLYCSGSKYCTDGDCFAERERIHQINEVQNVMFLLYASLNVAKLKFYNVIGSENSVKEFVQDVGRLVKTIRLMVDSCKDCCND